MPLNRIDISRLNEYKSIFGTAKMQFLWREFLAQSAQNWQNMAASDWNARRQIFHNWRSSAQVFGMTEFARLSQQIEDKILKHRLSGLEETIAACRNDYNQDTEYLKTIFAQMEE